MKTIPPISKVMTAMPHSVGADITLMKAHSMMTELGIRHLPVQEGGKLVGIISDRDVKLASSFKDGEKLLVKEVMTLDPYTVEPETSLHEVVKTMADHRYGCALVLQGNGKLVGIFTATDGLRELNEILTKHFAPNNKY